MTRFLFFRDIDKVDATMDDIRDQMDVANEISEAISRPVNVGDELDEVNIYSYCVLLDMIAHTHML